MTDGRKKAPRTLVNFSEESRLKRKLLAWVNTWPGKPVELIQYEQLPPDGEGMGMFSRDNGAYIEERFIVGGYRAAYDFVIAYRVQPGDGPDKRLAADETLDALGEWLCAGPYPELGEKLSVAAVECTARAAVSGDDQENGVEDHILTMKLTYRKESENPWLT